jgi:magnesium transporter
MADQLGPQELREAWPLLDATERVEGFLALGRADALPFFRSLSARSQAQILRGSPADERLLWARALAPDDLVDVLQELSPDERDAILGGLDDATHREVAALLAYAEDAAGGLMNPRFVRARPEMTVDEAIRYVRRQSHGQAVETIYYVYVLDAGQRLLGVLSVRELLAAKADSLLRDIMRKDVIKVAANLDREAVAKIVARHDLLAVPVVDDEGRMQGIVTVDDVVVAEATEDIQQFGGLEALDAPYMQTGFLPMLKKRAGWLAVLFIGEMLTARAMGHFEEEIERAVVLALFVPLIISSGGNSGSQASTLVIRAMALGEVKVADWFRIVRRELAAGLSLGAILASIGAARILLWQAAFGSYGEHDCPRSDDRAAGDPCRGDRHGPAGVRVDGHDHGGVPAADVADAHRGPAVPAAGDHAAVRAGGSPGVRAVRRAAAGVGDVRARPYRLAEPRAASCRAGLRSGAAIAVARALGRRHRRVRRAAARRRTGRAAARHRVPAVSR